MNVLHQENHLNFLPNTVDGSEIPNNHLACIPNLVNHGISTTFPSTGEFTGFLNHQQYVCIAHMDVSENNGTPKSSILIGFSMIFTIHFGGPPLFLETPISLTWHIFWNPNFRQLLATPATAKQAIDSTAIDHVHTGLKSERAGGSTKKNDGLAIRILPIVSCLVPKLVRSCFISGILITPQNNECPLKK